MKELPRAREYAVTVNVLTKGSFDSLIDTSARIVEQLKQSPMLRSFFDHPAIAAGEKLAMIDRMAQVSEGLLAHILHKLVARNDMALLPFLLSELVELRKKNANSLDVVIHSALELSTAQKAAVDKRVSEITGKKVLPRYQIDSSLIGGLRIRIGDKIVDNTVRTRMESLSDQLFIASLQ
jgi:F-type H+-transporting ATPase subunit delta